MTTSTSAVSSTSTSRRLLVRTMCWEAEGVVSLQLVDPAGEPLWPWEPGAHVDVVLPSGVVRQYSLCGDIDDVHAYTIAVLHEPQGRGGSHEVHTTPLLGRQLDVREPRNHFPLEPADDYLFVAGGIGITPIIPMVRAAQRSSTPWRLLYRGHDRRTMAFADAVTAVDPMRVEIVPSGSRPFHIDELEDTIGTTTKIYCCGPSRLLTAVQELGRRLGRERDIHIERFTNDADPPSAAPAGGELETFEVELRRSGKTVVVGPEQSILEAVRAVVPDVWSSCESGYCGTCETTVVEGCPVHRDSILSPSEQAAGKTMMICIGRSRSERLVLDL